MSYLIFVFLYIWLPGALLAFIAHCVSDKSYGWHIDWTYNIWAACLWPFDLLQLICETIYVILHNIF